MIRSIAHAQFNRTVRSIRKYGTEIKIMSERSLGKGSVCPPLKPGVLRLYSMRYCPYAQRTRLLLEYQKIPYETVNINLKSKPDWFFARNPVGLVPVLEKNDMIIYESNACNEYLDDIYPGKKLKSTDPVQGAKDRMLIESFGKVQSMFYDIPKSKAEGTIAKTLRRFYRDIARYEKALGERGDYFGGSGPNLVDFAVWPWFERLDVVRAAVPELELTPAQFPLLSKWMSRMMQLDAVKDTYMSPEEHIRFFAGLRAGNPDYDYGLP